MADGPRGGMTGRSAPSGWRGEVIGGVIGGGGATVRGGTAAFAAVCVTGGGTGICTEGLALAAAAAGLAGAAAGFACSASSTAKVNLGLPPLLPSGIFTSARCRAACTRCSARRSWASRCALSFSASFSPLTAGAAAAEPRGGAALTPGLGAMGAGLTAAGRAAAGAAGVNSSAMRGMSFPAPMPRRSRQLRLSVPLLEFWSIPFARSYISSTGLTPRMLSPLARE